VKNVTETRWMGQNPETIIRFHKIRHCFDHQTIMCFGGRSWL